MGRLLEMSKKILIVEDEANLRSLVSTILEIDGYQVITASNGKDGKTLAKENQPDLILLDVIMPGGNGYQIATELSLDSKTKQIPVVLMTGTSQVVGEGITFKTPAVGKLAKPFGKEQLLKTVKKFT